jgi:hypothetical protein
MGNENFQPVEVATEGGFQPIEEAPTSVVTGQPVPTAEEKIQAGKDVAAGAVRYGVPIAAGIATGGMGTAANLAINAATVGLSEITARQIERASTDPEMADLVNDLKAGGVAAGIDIGVGGSLAAIGRATNAIARRVLLPKTLNPSVDAAQTVLGRLTEKGKASRRFWNKWRGNNPFSLSLGQLQGEERNLVTFFESIARGGSGAGVMSRFDARNTDHIAEIMGNYFDMRTTGKSAPEIGQFINRFLNTGDDAISAIKPVQAYKKYLYKQFDRALENTPNAIVDGTQLREYLRRSTDQDILKIYSQCRSLGLLPPLKGKPSQTTRRVMTETRRSSASKGSQIADVTRENLLKPGSQLTRTKTKTDAERIGSGETQTMAETNRTILADTQPLDVEVDEAWKQLTAADVDKVIHTMNDFFVEGKEFAPLNKRIAKLRDQIEPQFEKVLSKNPEAKSWRDAANTFFGAKEDALFNKVLDQLRNTLNKTPSGVAAILDPVKGNAGVTYDKLMNIKNGIYFSSAVPYGMGKEGVDKMWESGILRPMRHRFLDASTVDGVLDPVKLMGNIQKIEKEAPEVLVELFGSSKQVDFIKEMASTWTTMLKSKPEKSVFIQLKTAAAIGGAGGGIWSYFNGDNPASGAATGAFTGAAVILASPYMMAKILTNTKMTRQLTDGIRQSNKLGRIAPAFGVALRKAAEMYPVSQMFREAQSTDAQAFYSFAPIEQQQQ